MVTLGERAPDFTIPIAGGGSYDDISEFTLSDAIGDGPIVLAFFPAAFTSGCTEEMCTFRDTADEFESLDAQVYGVSVDLPYAQNVWIQDHNLGIPMLSDWNHEVIRAYDVTAEGVDGLFEQAERSIYVIDEDGRIAYVWIREGGNPDFNELVDDVHAAIESLSAANRDQ